MFGLQNQLLEEWYEELRRAEHEARLAAAIGQKAVIDLIATVGFYSVLGYLLMTYETPVDADVAAAMARAPLPLP